MSWALGEKPKMKVTLPVVFKDKTPKKRSSKRRSPASEAEKKALSERTKLLWQDPDFRARHAAAARAAILKRLADPIEKARVMERLNSNKRKRIAKSVEARCTPEWREKMSAMTKKMWAEGKFNPSKYKLSPKGVAGRMAALAKINNRKRGFAVPKHLLEDYNNLVRRKGYKAREAALLLGIIKPIMVQKRAA